MFRKILCFLLCTLLSHSVFSQTMYLGSPAVVSPNQSTVYKVQGATVDIPFNEGSGSTAGDISGNNNALTLVNSPIWVAGGGVKMVGSSSHYGTLPAGITASAQTFQFAVDFSLDHTINAAAPLIGNSSNSGIVIIGGEDFNQGPIVNSGRMSVRSNGTVITDTADSIPYGRTSIITVVLNTSSPDQYYMDGRPIQLYYAVNGVQPTTGSMGLSHGPQFTICGYPGLGYCNSTYRYLMVWPRALTATEVMQNTHYVAQTLAARGVDMHPVDHTTGNFYLADGDSISTSIGGQSTPYVQQISPASGTYTALSTGIGSQSCDHIRAGFDGKDLGRFRPEASMNVFSLFCGTNDMIRAGTASRTPAQVFADQAAILQKAKRAGFRTILIPMLSRGGTGTGGATMDALHNQLNTLIETYGPGVADYVVPLSDLAGLIEDGANTNGNFLNDHVHPNTTGMGILGTAVSNGIDTIAKGPTVISGGSTSTYSYAVPFTIDHTKVPNTDQSNFVVSIFGTFAPFKTLANGGYAKNANGYDITWNTSVSCANGTRLNFEQSYYDPTNGLAEYYVRVPSVSHTADTALYACIGNSSITSNQSSTSTYDSTYGGIYHFGSGKEASDSTANANTLTFAPGTAGTGGKLGVASLTFDGTSQNAVAASTTGWPTGSAARSLCGWVAPTSNASDQLAFGYGGGASGSGFYAYLLSPLTSGYAGLFGGDGSNLKSVAWTSGAWHHMCLTANDGDSIASTKVYVDGALATTVTAGSSPNAALNTAAITPTFGSIAGGGIWFGGSVDEISIRNTVVSADRIAAEYANQNSPSTFYTVGSPISLQ